MANIEQKFLEGFTEEEKAKLLKEIARVAITTIVENIMTPDETKDFWKSRYIDAMLQLGEVKAELANEKHYDLTGLNKDSEVYKVYSLINRVKNIVYAQV